MTKFLGLLTDLILKAAAYFAAFLFGKENEKNKQNEKIIERVEKANIAVRDDTHDDKLRERYRK